MKKINVCIVILIACFVVSCGKSKNEAKESDPKDILTEAVTNIGLKNYYQYYSMLNQSLNIHPKKTMDRARVLMQRLGRDSSLKNLEVDLVLASTSLASEVCVEFIKAERAKAKSLLHHGINLKSKINSLSKDKRNQIITGYSNRFWQRNIRDSEFQLIDKAALEISQTSVIGFSQIETYSLSSCVAIAVSLESLTH